MVVENNFTTDVFETLIGVKWALNWCGCCKSFVMIVWLWASSGSILTHERVDLNCNRFYKVAEMTAAGT